MAEKFSNNASSTLSTGVNAVVTTLPVAAGGAPFPTSGTFRVRVESELMIVTGGQGTNSWTVTRGAEGTTAAAHTSGTGVTHVLTAGALQQSVLDTVASANRSNGARLATFGHSYNDPNAVVGVTLRRDLYGARLAELLGMIEDNYHVAGTYAIQGTGNAYDRAIVQLPALPTTPPLRAPVNAAAIYVGHNDISPTLQPSIATEPSILTDFIRAIIHGLRAGVRSHANNMTLAQGSGGTNWSTTSSASWFGGSLRFATANGNTWTLNTPATFPGGKVQIWGMRNSATGAVHTITLDGVAQTSWDTRGATTTTNRPTFYEITVGAGAHSIVGTITNLVGGVEHLNYFQYVHADPPPVAYANVARTPSAANGQSDSVVATFKPLLAAIATQFTDGRVVCIEADDILNKDTTLFGDGTHPSPRGAALLADAFATALAPLMTQRAQLSQATDQVLGPGAMRALLIDKNTGADPRVGTATLVAGVVTITTRAVQSDSIIIPIPKGSSATMGTIVETARTATNSATAGTVTFTSKDFAGATVTGDTRSFDWVIVQPA